MSWLALSYTYNDIYVVWDCGRDNPIRGRVSLERPDESEGWEVSEQFFPGMYYGFTYEPKTNELIIGDFEDSLELRIGYDLSVRELISIQKNVN